MLALLLFILGVIGFCYGSFINVLIYRIPNKISIIKPRSFCPQCKNPIPIYRNIPVLSFIFQFGKCHNCNKKISLQYPCIEIITGFLWLFFILQINQIDIANPIISIIIVSFLIPLAIIDLKHLYFPISLITPLIITGIASALINSFVYSNNEGLIGMATAISFLGSIYLIVKIWFKIKKRNDTPMGFGDFLLIVPLGAWIGPVGVILCLFLASTFALVLWITLYFLGKFSLAEKMPFGPYLIGSSIIIKIMSLDQLISALIFQIR